MSGYHFSFRFLAAGVGCVVWISFFGNEKKPTKFDAGPMVTNDVPIVRCMNRHTGIITPSPGEMVPGYFDISIGSSILPRAAAIPETNDCLSCSN